MTVQITTGDCRAELRNMPDKSVHLVVSSPPYFGLRDYGTGEWSGGDPACHHVVGTIRRGLGLANSPASTRGGAIKCTEVNDIQARAECPHCGAVRTDRQMGLEATPAAFVAELVALFREIRRVLRDDGTVWLNLGDSYVSNGRYASDKSNFVGELSKYSHRDPRTGARTDGIKTKDLMGIPWRVALALQDDGWYLRQDIVWSKPNPMPESVTDRCTKSHEYLFLLSKSESYFFDQFAILEPASPNTHARLSQKNIAEQFGSTKANGGTREDRPFKPVVATRGLPPRHAQHAETAHRDLGTMPVGGRKCAAPGQGIKNNSSFDAAMAIMPLARNRRSVWTIATQSFSGEFCRDCQTYFEGRALRALRVEKIVHDNGRKERRRFCTCGKFDAWVAHFATFPAALITPCILAGTSVHGACADCGAPWERVVENTTEPRADFLGSTFDSGRTLDRACQSGNPPAGGDRYGKASAGFRPTCSCGQTNVVPCTVLDPFGGAGTTGVVSARLGRDAVLFELNPDYAEMARQRIGADANARHASPMVRAKAREVAAPLPLFAA